MTTTKLRPKPRKVKKKTVSLPSVKVPRYVRDHYIEEGMRAGRSLRGQIKNALVTQADDARPA